METSPTMTNIVAKTVKDPDRHSTADRNEDRLHCSKFVVRLKTGSILLTHFCSEIGQNIGI